MTLPRPPEGSTPAGFVTAWDALASAVEAGASLVQVGTATLPDTPVVGQTVSVLADPGTVLPPLVTWDAGGPPVITTGRRMISLLWSGDDWVGTYSPPIPGVAATLSEAILALDPAGYWRLDETTGTTATDSSGNDRHGTYTGDFTLAARDGAPVFTGTGWVSIGDHDAWSVGEGGLSVFAIGYVTADSPGPQFFAAKGAAAAYEWGMGIHWPDQDRSTHAAWWTPAGDNWQTERTAGAHPKDVWSAVTATFGVPSSAGARFSLYRDTGTPLVTTQHGLTGSPSPAAGAAPLILGGRGDGAGTIAGSLRHVAIFDKQLTAGQVSALMNAARGEGLIP